MKKYLKIVSLLFVAIVAYSCGNEVDTPSSNNIEINLSSTAMRVVDMSMNVTPVRATAAAATPEQEQQIDNVYVFMFSTTAPVIKFYTESLTQVTYNGVTGTWTKNDDKKSGKVVLQVSPAVAGARKVYVVANCADIKSDLDAVTTEAGLKEKLRTLATPWTAETPLLMEGSADKTFTLTDTKLETVELTRAVAKVSINVSMGDDLHKGGAAEQYTYQYFKFGTKTYVCANPTQQANTADMPSAAVIPDFTTTYTANFAFYLNEYAATVADKPYVELKMPLINGSMPPPEFKPDTYTIKMPATVERNTHYVYTAVIKG